MYHEETNRSSQRESDAVCWKHRRWGRLRAAPCAPATREEFVRLLIVGGDAAGMSAASQARRIDPECEIIVLEMTEDVSYGACGLPYMLPAGGEMDNLVVITAEQFRNKRGIDVRLQHRVTELDPSTHVVRGEAPEGSFELAYDAVILATGAEVSLPPISGLGELLGDGAYPLKTLEDGRVLKAALAREPRSAVVIGGGYIGLEAAENLREEGLDVTIVEALPQILAFLPDDLRQRVYSEAEAHSVPLHVDTRVYKLVRAANGEIRLQTGDGDLSADLVLVATGVRPCSAVAAEAGLELGPAGSIAVNQELQTSAADVWSAGDCADAFHGISGKRVWTPLALRANRAGKLAGANALGKHESVPPVLGTAVFQFFNQQVARSGLTVDEAREAGFDPVEGSVSVTEHAHYLSDGSTVGVWLLADRASGRLLGGAMVGPHSAAFRIDTVAACLHGGLNVQQLYDMDLAYAPVFGPAWSPLLICASQLLKQL